MNSTPKILKIYATKKDGSKSWCGQVKIKENGRMSYAGKWITTDYDPDHGVHVSLTANSRYRLDTFETACRLLADHADEASVDILRQVVQNNAVMFRG